MLDTLCLTGEIGWARLSPTGRDATQMVGATPIALFLREHASAWAALKDCGTSNEDGTDQRLGSPERDEREGGRLVIEALRTRGASFIADLTVACGLDEAAVRTALGDLVAAGLAASDGFGGLRSIIRASSGRQPQPSRGSVTGRWSLLSGVGLQACDRETAVELQARTLLKRYGVVFRRLLAREANVAPWRELIRVYRRLEARGEIRGGRFVSGMSGEQFALVDAIERLREIRRTPADGVCLVISAADPLNLAGILTAGDKVRAVAPTRMAYRDGVPVAVLEGDYVRPLIALTDVAPAVIAEVATTLVGRPVAAVLSGFVGRS
jgi:ATP-dependent Lhr-like helicase